VKIKEIRDPDLIKKVMFHPAIFGCITCDKSKEIEETILHPNAQYVAGFVDNAIIGIVIYEVKNSKTMAHIQVLPEYRKEYAIKFARMALNLGMAKNATVYAEIPVCYPNVISFAKKVGFEQTGETIDSYTKNGITHNEITLRRKDGVF